MFLFFQSKWMLLTNVIIILKMVLKIILKIILKKKNWFKKLNKKMIQKYFLRKMNARRDNAKIIRKGTIISRSLKNPKGIRPMNPPTATFAEVVPSLFFVPVNEPRMIKIMPTKSRKIPTLINCSFIMTSVHTFYCFLTHLVNITYLTSII